MFGNSLKNFLKKLVLRAPSSSEPQYAPGANAKTAAGQRVGNGALISDATPPLQKRPQPQPSFEYPPVLDSIVSYVIGAERALRVTLLDIVSLIVAYNGGKLEQCTEKSFEGLVKVTLSTTHCAVAAEEYEVKKAEVKAGVLLLAQLGALQHDLSSVLKVLESSKFTLKNFLAYQLLVTGLFPRFKVTRKPPGVYEVEVRSMRIVNGTLQQGAVIANWFSENLQDAYARVTKDAMVRAIAARRESTQTHNGLHDALKSRQVKASSPVRRVGNQR